MEDLRWRASENLVAPLHVLRLSVEQIDKFLESELEENVLFARFEKLARNCGKIGEKERRRMLKRLGEMLGKVKEVYSSLRELAVVLEEKAPREVGLWRLERGEEIYQFFVEEQTTTKMTALEVHRVGLEEVEKTQKAMREILEKEGYDAPQFCAAIQKVKKEARFLFEESEEGKKLILRGYRELLRKYEKKWEELIGITPSIGMLVNKVPAFKEKSAPHAYYTPPSLDRKRKGTFFCNVRQCKDHPTFSMKSLFFHEGVPGHHYQLTIAQDQKHLPLFRQNIPWNAYAEGWALYVERLADEFGFYEDNFERLGWLQFDLLRSVRLVVDTALHCKEIGWGREEAIKYMHENTGLDISLVTAEVDRYAVMPAQALGYKVGQLSFLRLRERAKERLASKFSLQEFHKTVLKCGAVPLSLLERIVEEWVEEKIN